MVEAVVPNLSTDEKTRLANGLRDMLRAALHQAQLISEGESAAVSSFATGNAMIEAAKAPRSRMPPSQASSTKVLLCKRIWASCCRRRFVAWLPTASIQRTWSLMVPYQLWRTTVQMASSARPSFCRWLTNLPASWCVLTT